MSEQFCGIDTVGRKRRIDLRSWWHHFGMVNGAELGVEAARRLASVRRCTIAPGLLDVEFARVEHEYGFEFADDHRAFLAAGLPRGNGWPDWRDGDPDDLRWRLDRPVSGVLFDVEHDEVWHDTWGERPADLADALATARQHLARVHTMVPVYAHRYLPAGRGTSGHPVLSIMQTDIIYYGVDLIDYIHQEFGGPGIARSDPRWQPHSSVAFWSDYL
jgi:hypothetical protein